MGMLFAYNTLKENLFEYVEYNLIQLLILKN
jgi:hypothetical protein